ncbi:MAG: FAD-binding and (Fe-S)-binding domain-containing protein [Acidimicrobiales bacterium]
MVRKSESEMEQQVTWRTDRLTRTVYATDNSIYQLTPSRVGLPDDAAQIAASLRANYALDAPQPFVARGGGTGTNGQSLTEATTVDLKRNMNQLRSVDVANRTAVVQPGIVTADLNSRIAEHGLFWPPHTSTLNRATVGGMISTDAAGKGSLVYGRAHRHVKRLVMLLDDGSEWVAEPVSEPEAERRASEPGRGAQIWRAILDLELPDDGTLGLPELARGFSGYGLDRLRSGGMVNPIALVCGAEGTLGILVEATIDLSPIPDLTRLVVASYASFGDALEDAVALRETGPVAIESFDETTLERGRSSPAWPALGDAIGNHSGAVLLLEYDGEAATDLDAIMATISATGRSRARQVVDGAAEQASIWKVRADAVGLLAKVAVGGPALSARPTAFVEDCAVPVAVMPEFISEFRKVLDDAGLMYGMFGHADVGCVHVRPAVDLTDSGQRGLVAEVTDKVIDLVTKYGGLVWGEHGRGFRGAHVDQVLPAATVVLMRQVKTAFDPRDIFNPGKLYRPLESNLALVDVADPPMRGEIDARVELTVRRDFDSAFACNGNGLCHHYSVDEVMCPSYKATGDPALSPRGRVDLLRSWLSDRGSDPDFEDALAENLHQCLSCSACSGRCPVEVNIPELKSRFFDDYHSRNRRPLGHHLMSRFEELASLAGRFPRLASLGLKPAERLLGLVDLPAPRATKVSNLPTFTGQDDIDVVLVPDVFTSALEPETLAQAVLVLQSLGYVAAVSKFVGSGKFDHVKGRRSRFAKAVARQADLILSITAAGAVPVVVEPAVALLHRHEYPATMASYPSADVRSLADLLLERVSELSVVGGGELVVLLGHCTERATEPALAAGWTSVLQAAGYQVQAPEVGCCGMAGVFGHEAANQQMSKDLWDLSWAPRLENTSAKHLVATGYSCRSQAKRFSDTHLVHPLHLLTP